MIKGKLATLAIKFGFLGLPSWYEYLNKQPDGSPKITSLTDIWLIVAAIVEILLRLASIVAVVMVIYGGIKYITSQGDPESAKQARGTIINALVGLLIAIGAATLITFIAGRFHGS